MLAAGLVIAAVVEGIVADALLDALGTAVLVPTVLIRRSHPLLAVAIVFGGSSVTTLVVGRSFPEQTTLAFLLLLPFSLLRWGSGRDAVLGAVLMLGKVGLSAALGLLPVGEALAGCLILFCAMAFGAALRYRTRARIRELDQVKLLERERLARDLHDTVAHHVSAMAIRAQAGIATAATNPDAAVDALRVIDAEAARALDEMRGVVRLLREDGAVAERSPGPRAGDLTALATQDKPAVGVELVGDVDGLPAPVSAAIFRVAQEAVTNARRHARHATRVDVRVVVDDTAVRLSVRDDGGGSAPGIPGYGIVGMVERAGLLGGTCEAGPGPGGWTVTAVLPRTGATT